VKHHVKLHTDTDTDIVCWAYCCRLSYRSCVRACVRVNSGSDTERHGGHAAIHVRRLPPLVLATPRWRLVQPRTAHVVPGRPTHRPRRCPAADRRLHRPPRRHSRSARFPATHRRNVLLDVFWFCHVFTVLTLKHCLKFFLS